MFQGQPYVIVGVAHVAPKNLTLLQVNSANPANLLSRDEQRTDSSTHFDKFLAVLGDFRFDRLDLLFRCYLYLTPADTAHEVHANRRVSAACECGFTFHHRLPSRGLSPDGLVAPRILELIAIWRSTARASSSSLRPNFFSISCSTISMMCSRCSSIFSNSLTNWLGGGA